jgi:hypothetical protein
MEDTIATLEDTNLTIKAIAAQLSEIERIVLKNSVGRKLRGIRRSSGVSLGEMCRKLCMNRDELIEIENNATDARWVETYRLAVGEDIQ